MSRYFITVALVDRSAADDVAELVHRHWYSEKRCSRNFGRIVVVMESILSSHAENCYVQGLTDDKADLAIKAKDLTLNTKIKDMPYCPWGTSRSLVKDMKHALF